VAGELLIFVAAQRFSSIMLALTSPTVNSEAQPDNFLKEVPRASQLSYQRRGTALLDWYS
jgi:hypothetical protein